MSHLRRAAAVDENQSEIVTALRRAGCTVEIIGKPVDLAVGVAGRTYLLEVKKNAKAKLTPAQANFFASWDGHVARVDNVAEALKAVGIEIRET